MSFYLNWDEATKNKKQICFMDRRTSQVGSVGTFFCLFLFVSGGKSDPKKHRISTKNQTIFEEKKLENILIYFQKFSTKILRFWSKQQLILPDIGKLKKFNSPKMEKKNGSVTRHPRKMLLFPPPPHPLNLTLFKKTEYWWLGTSNSPVS